MEPVPHSIIKASSKFEEFVAQGGELEVAVSLCLPKARGKPKGQEPFGG
jgi:hypothetical protein